MDLAVELFCGQEKPFSMIAEAFGYPTLTVDTQPDNEPKLVGEIAAALAGAIPPNPFLVWAAPPFSNVFRSSESWESDGSLDPQTDEAEGAINTINDLLPVMPPFMGRVCSGYAPQWGVLQTRSV